MSFAEKKLSLILFRSGEEDSAQKKGFPGGWSGFNGKTSGARSTIRETKGGCSTIWHLRKQKREDTDQSVWEFEGGKKNKTRTREVLAFQVRHKESRMPKICGGNYFENVSLYE